MLDLSIEEVEIPRCPYCGSQNHHFVGTMNPENFDEYFKQGCKAAVVVSCEPSPGHIFLLLIGEHKGSMLIHTACMKKAFK